MVIFYNIFFEGLFIARPFSLPLIFRYYLPNIFISMGLHSYLWIVAKDNNSSQLFI